MADIRFIAFTDKGFALAERIADGLASWAEGDGARRLVPTARGWLMGNELYGALWDLAEGTPITSETS